MNIHSPLIAILMGTAMMLAGSSSTVLAVDDEVEPEIVEAARKFNESQQYDRNKIVCTKEARTGTRIKATVCRNVAAIARGEEEAKRYLDRMRTSFRPEEQ